MNPPKSIASRVPLLPSLAALVSAACMTSVSMAAPFTSGNIAVFQADASANNTTASIVELSPTNASQAPTNVIALDGATAAVALRFSGSASSTGYLANSADGSLLAFAGANNTSTSVNVNTLNPRAVGTFNNAGSFSLATTYTGTSGNQTRCATSLNNSNWFIGEQGGLYTNAATSASPSGNFRGSKTFGDLVYLSQASATATLIQIGTVSAITGGTLTGLPGLANNASLQDFYLISSGSNSTSFDVLYVLSATSNTAGSISKYSLVAGTWTANGTAYTTTFGGFGLAAQKSGSGAALFISTGLGAATANSVLGVTDTTGFNTALNIITANNVTLYTAPTGKIIKGVAFAPVSVSAAPAITGQPSSSTIGSGNTATLTVMATGSATLSYQWYQGGSGTTTTPVGTNSSSFTTPPLTAATSYWVRVSNGTLPDADSNTAVITVNVFPSVTSITPADASTNVPVGSTITLNFSTSVSLTSSAITLEAPSGTPVTFSGLPASNVTSVTLTPANTLPYNTVVSVTVDKTKVTDDSSNNMVADFTSSFTTLAAVAPGFTTQPANMTILSGGAATFTVAATGTPTPTFQWYQGNSGDTSNPIGSATSTTYTTPALTSTTSFWVQATNAVSGTNSNTATVSISPAYTGAFRDITTPNTGVWPAAGVTLNGTQFVNLGLQGVGRVPASAIDPVTGESLGSISDMQITGWAKNANGSYSGKFNFLPDRGYNSGSVYSNYAARINAYNFTFTPYTASAATTNQDQVAMTFDAATRFTYGAGNNFTSGLPANGTTTLSGMPAPAVAGNTTQSDGTVANRLTIDSEGLALDKRAGKSGTGWVSDEYGPFIYHFDSSKHIDGQLQLPAAILPHAPAGTVSFVDTNVNGRRTNQGMEGLAQSPSGNRLFGLLQSATLQDSGSTNDGRSNTRLLVYDVSSSDTPNDPVAQYVIQLPRINSSGNGGAVNRNGAQSCILALNDHQILILSRDGNGRGSSGTPVFKSILLAELNGATNIDGSYDAEAAGPAPGGVLSPTVTPLSWTEALNLIGGLGATPTEVAKFGLNLNPAPGDINSICEKWEALSMVSCNDSANPNDFFLFVGNDNDFLTASGKYMDANGALQGYSSGLENDTLILAYRVRMTGPDNQAPIISNTIPNQSAVTGAALNYQLPPSVFSDPENGMLTYSATGTDDTALPAWLSFDPATRTFSGRPATADIGTLVVKVTATDNGAPNLSASTSFNISISPLTFLGVAAGDADSNSATLWTHTNEGVTASINAEVATDLAFTAPVSFSTVTDSTKDYTAKVTATGLTSGTKFYYRFVASGSSETSGVGTFKTAPAANAAAMLHFAFSGDNDGLMRPYALASVIPSQNLDFYVNLGDVIYENASNLTTSGAHNGAPWLNSPSVALSNDSLSYNGVPRAFIPSGAPFATSDQLKADYEKKYRENFLPVNTGGQNSLQVLYTAQGNYTTWDNHELGNRKYIDGGAPAGGSVGGASGTDMATGRGVDARNNGAGNPGNMNDACDVLTPAQLAAVGGFMNKAPGFVALENVFLNYQPIADRGTINAPADPRTHGTKQLYSAQQWGKNAVYINTDSRSYRDIRLKTATAGADETTAPRANNANRTMLGATHLAWLKQTLLDAQTAGTPWKFVSIADPIDQLGPIGGSFPATPAVLTGVSSDGGKSYIGGYRAERNALLKFIADNHITNVVFLSCDDHQNRINELAYSPTGQTEVQSSYVNVPFCFAIVCGPLGATGPDAITNHAFSNIKNIADSLYNAQVTAGIEPIGLQGYPGLKNVMRENDPTAGSSPQAADFYSPDTFNFNTLDVSADGKTLTVSSIGMNSTAQNSGTEYSAGPQARTVFSFQIDVPTELQLWRAAKFGTNSTAGNLGNDADYDNDGIANLVEYALGGDPTIGTGANGPSALPVPLGSDADPLLTDRLALSFVLPEPTPADITYRVQASDDLATWSDVASKAGSGSWMWLGGGSSHIVTTGSGPVAVKIGDAVPSAGNPKRLMRLKVTSP